MNSLIGDQIWLQIEQEQIETATKVMPWTVVRDYPPIPVWPDRDVIGREIEGGE